MSWLALSLELVAGLSAGAWSPDGDLRDYRWDVSPHAALGAHATLTAGRTGAGLHLWTTSTTQDTGLDDVDGPSVRLTSAELQLEWRALSLARIDLLATAAAGRVHLGYSPDEAVYDVEGTSVTVAFDPIDEWIGGAGLALRRPVTARLGAGLRLDYRTFHLDTAHRNGDVIERSRERFENWSGRLELNYRFGLN